jgi:CelD/BcsL family acetyltransferase involved in cellulose biosynthesis
MNTNLKRTSLRCRVLPMRQVTGELYDQWQNLLQRSQSHRTPFLHPEFALLAAEVGRPVNVAVVERGEQLVAVHPFEQPRRGVASPVAARLNDFQGVLVEQRHDWSSTEFMRQSRVSRIHFDHLLNVDHTFPSSERTLHRSPYVELNQGFSAYREQLKATGNKHLEDIFQKDRKAQRAGHELRFTFHDPQPEVVEQLVAWKQAQYARTEALDVFQQAWVRKIIHRVAKMQQPNFGGVVSTLHAGNDLVAIHLGMYACGTLHYWFPAYDSAHAVAKYAPGLQLVAHLLQEMPEHGLTRLDFGRGNERYKQELATGEVAVAEGTLGRSSSERIVQESWLKCRRLLKEAALLFGWESSVRWLRQQSWQRAMR